MRIFLFTLGWVSFALACSSNGAGTTSSSSGNGASSSASSSSSSGGTPALRVLFVGNSYTYVNDLPAVVHALGEATPNARVEVESVVVAGTRLSDHWLNTGGRERVQEGGWDAVVMQGQSLEPVYESISFDEYAQLFAD